MNGLFHVSSSPHVRSEETTGSIMYDVAIALIPATAFGVYRFGLYSLLILLVSVAFAILSEYVWQKLTNQPSTIMDGSALVTGLLLGLNMPPRIPIWVPALGSIFAIIFVKQVFGGIGQNFMNPALGARCFLLISFTGLMSNFAVDGMSGATPLADLAAKGKTDIVASFLGFTSGTIGEVSTLAILIGLVYLLWKRIITWEIPAAYLGVFAVFELILGAKPLSISFTLAQICSGGIMLGAVFMATDYVSSPITKNGKLLYGAILGILTGIFRTYGVSAEGVSYAIIIGNLLVPLIEKVTMPVAFGYEPGAITGEKRKLDITVYKPAVMLVGITIVAGLALGGVYELTKAPIQKAEEAAAAAAYVAVCPGAESFQESEELLAAEDAVLSGECGGDHGNIAFESVYEGLDAGGNLVGYVVNVTSKDGFGGEITISVGIKDDETVTGMEFLTINETAGLGMRASEPEFMDQYIDVSVDQFELLKEGADEAGEIQALSGATITSTAVTNAMNAALHLVAGLNE